jgi:hypothetical protein
MTNEETGKKESKSELTLVAEAINNLTMIIGIVGVSIVICLVTLSWN